MVMEKTAIIFIGIQASGKTTFYRQNFSSFRHINLDTLRTRERERKEIELCQGNGISYVVDNTNPTVEDRQRYIPAARQHGYKVIGYYFRASVRESAERNAKRDRVVPRIAIAGTSAKLQMPSYSEGFDEIYYVRIKDSSSDKSENFMFEIMPWQEEK